VQQCRAIEVGWLQSRSKCVLKRTTSLTWQQYCLVCYGLCGRFLVVCCNCCIMRHTNGWLFESSLSSASEGKIVKASVGSLLSWAPFCVAAVVAVARNSFS
jgi:hypothetical protein